MAERRATSPALASHIQSAHMDIRAPMFGRHGARNPCPMCGRKNYRAGEVCQPDSSWPNGTYQWRDLAGRGGRTMEVWVKRLWFSAALIPLTHGVTRRGHWAQRRIRG